MTLQKALKGSVLPWRRPGKLSTARSVPTINPLVPDAHYSERQDKPFSLQIQRLEVDLKLNCGFIFCNLGTNGLKVIIMGALRVFRDTIGQLSSAL